MFLLICLLLCQTLGLANPQKYPDQTVTTRPTPHLHHHDGRIGELLKPATNVLDDDLIDAMYSEEILLDDVESLDQYGKEGDGDDDVEEEEVEAPADIHGGNVDPVSVAIPKHQTVEDAMSDVLSFLDSSETEEFSQIDIPHEGGFKAEERGKENEALEYFLDNGEVIVYYSCNNACNFLLLLGNQN